MTVLSVEEYKSLSRRAAQIWTSRRFSELAKFYSPQCVHHQQKEQKTFLVVGIEAWRTCIETFLRSHPGYSETVTMQIAEEDKVVNVLDCQSTNQHWSGIVIDRFEGDKICETRAWFRRVQQS